MRKRQVLTTYILLHIDIANFNDTVNKLLNKISTMENFLICNLMSIFLDDVPFGYCFTLHQPKAVLSYKLGQFLDNVLVSYQGTHLVFPLFVFCNEQQLYFNLSHPTVVDKKFNCLYVILTSPQNL